MKQNKKTLGVVVFTLLAVITLGLGYAAISAIVLTINGTATATPDTSNYSVEFTEILQETNADADILHEDGEPDVNVTFTTSGLTKAGDTATVQVKIENNSPDLKANLSINTSSTNSEYFSVSSVLADNVLEAGDYTTVTLTVTVPELSILLPLACTIFLTPTTSAAGTLNGTPTVNSYWYS